MTVHALLDLAVPPLPTSDTAGHALLQVVEAGLAHLPVVEDDGHLRTTVSGPQLAALDPKTALSVLPALPPVSVAPETHVFEAARLMIQHHLSALPVVSDDGLYIGLLRRTSLFDLLARMLSTGESGAILVLEIHERDYTLSQLVYLIEQNDVKILSISTEREPGGDEDHVSPYYRVTLKLNVTDTTRVRHILEHYNYRVTGTFGSDQEDDDELQYRLLQFMRYLDV